LARSARHPLLLSGLLALLGLLALVGPAGCGSGASGPALTRCPQRPLDISGGGSPGAAGETVRTEPVSALICRWRANRNDRIERDETLVRGSGLKHLVRALNALAPGEEGEYACPAATELDYLVDLRYADAGDIEVEAEFGGCGSVRTGGGWWWTSGELRKVMDALLGGWVPSRHRSKPPFFTAP
jgi:hypothetical protein